MKSKEQLEEALAAIGQRFRQDHAGSPLIKTFSNTVRRFASASNAYIREGDIQPLADLPRLESLPEEQGGGDYVSQTVLFKLNGGLGTSMGLDHAKALIRVKGRLTFLDIIARQVQRLRETARSPLPLVLMNSFSTHADTLNALARHDGLAEGQDGIPVSFLQHRVPKLQRETLLPVDHPEQPDLTWCPPGHGDFYTALLASGMLEQLLARGFRYAFISNADNLGATLDWRILHHMARTGCPFLMEVTERTDADRKGGHLAGRTGGGLLLRESAQCHPEETDSFQDIERHRFFNTNNLWINLEALSRKLAEQDGILELPIIANEKTVNPQDPASTPVYQLETAMGAAIQLFADAAALCVPRTRFAPVKKTSDLLLLWSDLYELDAQARLVTAAGRKGAGNPLVKLEPRFYRLFHDFLDRFPHGAPSLLECEALEIEGDWLFGRDVRVVGRVHLPAPRHQVRLKDGTVLDQDFSVVEG